MPEKNNIIIGDADILVALAYTEDVNHRKIKHLVERLLEHSFTIKFPNTAVLEAITALKRALNQSLLSEWLNKKYQENTFGVIYIDESIQMLASEIFAKSARTGSKKHTIFDAVVLATAQQTKAQGIFSLDKWYEKQKIPLVQNLIDE